MSISYTHELSFHAKDKGIITVVFIHWSQDYFFIQPINTENVKAWCRRPFVGRSITVMSHERWAVSNHRQSTTGNSLFMPTTRKRLKLRITGPLWGESTDGRWIPLTKGQKCEMYFHVMTSPLIVHHGCKMIQSQLHRLYRNTFHSVRQKSSLVCVEICTGPRYLGIANIKVILDVKVIQLLFAAVHEQVPDAFCECVSKGAGKYLNERFNIQVPGEFTRSRRPLWMVRCFGNNDDQIYFI